MGLILMQTLSKPPASLLIPESREQCASQVPQGCKENNCPPPTIALHHCTGYPGPHLPRLGCASAFTQTIKVALVTSLHLVHPKYPKARMCFGSVCRPSGWSTPTKFMPRLVTVLCTTVLLPSRCHGRGGGFSLC